MGSGELFFLDPTFTKRILESETFFQTAVSSPNEVGFPQITTQKIANWMSFHIRPQTGLYVLYSRTYRRSKLKKFFVTYSKKIKKKFKNSKMLKKIQKKYCGMQFCAPHPMVRVSAVLWPFCDLEKFLSAKNGLFSTLNRSRGQTSPCRKLIFHILG